MKPLVSVIIPVYNRESTIERAIDSILKQTYKEVEIIVVDDCSIDRTKDRIMKYGGQRIRLLEQKEHGGAARARNVGIKEAKGEYIAFQDSDDEWVENKLEKQIGYMVREGFLISYCPYRLFDGNWVRIVPDIYENNDMCSIDILESLKKGNIIGTPTLVINRTVIQQIGYFDESMNALQDYEYAIRMARKFRIGYIGIPLVNAYRMNSCISNNREFLQCAQLEITKKYTDFIDWENMLYNYFDTSGLFEKNIVQWNKLEKVMAILPECQIQIEREQIYKLALDYVYNHYLKIKMALVDRYKNFQNCLKNKGFAIYGAGYFGRKAYFDLIKEGLKPELFLVTQSNTESDIDGIPIVPLQSWEDNEKPIIVAVSWEKQNEITNILISKNIFNFCIYPFC